MTTLTSWMPLAFLAAIAIPAAWLNARPAKAGIFAERMAWLATLCSLAAYGLWFAYGQASMNATLADGGLFGIRLDALSLPILSLVAFLGAVIIRFSRNYLSGDETQGGFFKWLVVTLGAVMALTLSPGLLQFWLAWVLCSFGLHQLLIYFPDRLGTLLSARKKFVVSRLGDLCLIIAFFGLYNTFGTQNFSELFALAQNEPELLMNMAWIAWLIASGALLKSAQLPFHTWLPDTMGAPTPVSALMHAGIINAGGFLVIRMSPILISTPSALSLLAVVGAITLIGASLIMLTQNSVKRTLAFSTIAQMGFMMLQCGLGAFSLAALHLVAHSLYKAHAFLSSGSSVATIKQLESRPQTGATPFMLVCVVVGSLSTVALMAWVFGLSFSSKPGLLVFMVVLAMALSQYLIAHIKKGKSLMGVSKLGLTGVGLAGLYLGLAEITMYYFSDTLPAMQTAGPILQSTLACVLGMYFLLTIVLQTAQAVSYPGFVQALYVHTLNGFYLNTLANRISRSIGLVPQGR